MKNILLIAIFLTLAIVGNAQVKAERVEAEYQLILSGDTMRFTSQVDADDDTIATVAWARANGGSGVGLTSVTSDATLTGDGTAGDPLIVSTDFFDKTVDDSDDITEGASQLFLETTDRTVLDNMSVVGSDMLFEDGNNTTPVTLSELLAGGTSSWLTSSNGIYYQNGLVAVGRTPDANVTFLVQGATYGIVKSTNTAASGNTEAGYFETHSTGATKGIKGVSKYGGAESTGGIGSNESTTTSIHHGLIGESLSGDLGFGVTGKGIEGDFLAYSSGLYSGIEIASTPSTPETGFWDLYVKTDGIPYLINDAGTEYNLASSGGSGVTAVSAGDGLNFTTVTATGPVTLGTPSSLTASTTNAVTTTSHTHALDLTDAVGLTELTATGTPSATTYLRGDNSWATISGSGTVIEITAGNGLDFSDITTTGSVTLGTPEDVNATSTNSVSTTGHSHVLDLTGAVDIADLSATGTPSSTTYLRGDGTWSTGTGTGGIGTVTSVIAGNGLDFTTITGDGSVTMGTPSTIDAWTTNYVSSTSHTHELDVSNISISTLQIDDFDDEIAQNTTVSTNTSYRHVSATLAGSYDYITLSGQELTLGQIDWDTDISNKPDVGTQALTETAGAASWDVSNGLNATITIDEPTLITLYNIVDGDILKIRVVQGDSDDDDVTFVIDGFSGATEEWRNGQDLSDETGTVDYISVSYSLPYLGMTIGKNYIAQE